MKDLKYLAALIALYLCGVVSGMASTANAGILTHIAAYEIGKHNGKSEVKEDSVCPKQK